MSFEPDVDIRRNLLELAPGCFDDAEYDDQVAMLARRLAVKPLRKFNATDLYAAIRLNVGLPWVVPLAMARLEEDPFVAAGSHPGDLLTTVLESDSRFWLDRRDLWLAMVEILGQALTQATDAAGAAHRAGHPDETEETGEMWMPNYLGDDFMGALLHFRGIHSD
jgi:hypothetical protein